MKSLSDYALENTVMVREDLFGKSCTFLSFQTDEAENFVCSDGMQSTGRFGRIVYRREGKQKYSDHLFLKVTPKVVLMKMFTTLTFFNETFFYTRILPFFVTLNPKIDLMFPKYYNSLLQYNVHADEVVIVFENLQAKNYKVAERKSFLDYDHLKLMMRKLGEFHAYSYRAKEESPEVFYSLTRGMIETNAFVLKQVSDLSMSVTRSFEPLSKDLRFRRKIEKIRHMIERPIDTITNAFASEESNHTHVICHGDYLRNNLLFKYEDGKPVDLKLIDLATWRYGSPVTDLGLVLYLNADQKMRDENWDNLIDEYYNSLRKVFPRTKVPSKEEILAEFEMKAMAVYLIASRFLPALIADDYDDVPKRKDLIPPQYEDKWFKEMPLDVNQNFRSKWGGHRATTASIDILKDIIDRDFV